MIKLPVLFSQRDSRWKLKKLGYGTGSIGSYGCLLVSYTMLLNHFGIKLNPVAVNENMKNRGGYSGVTKNLWNWYVADVLYDTAYQGSKAYNNSAVLKLLNNGIPVIIKVDGAPIGGLSHYVLAIGDGKIADPWTGTIKSFSSYKALGYNAYDYKGEIMPDSNDLQKEYDDCRTDRDAHWNNLQVMIKANKELESTVSSQATNIANIQKENKTLIKQLVEMENTALKAEELREKWHTLYKQSQTNFKDCKAENQVMRTKIAMIENTAFGSASTKELINELIKRLFGWQSPISGA